MITFYESEQRRGGIANAINCDIKFYGAFAEPSSKCEMGGNYSADFCDYYTGNDMQAYLMAVVTHELGHVIETDEMERAYQEFFPNDEVKAGERFAEDLRCFIMDGRVATVDGRMKNIPYVDERLALMKSFVEKIRAGNN